MNLYVRYYVVTNAWWIVQDSGPFAEQISGPYDTEDQAVSQLRR